METYKAVLNKGKKQIDYMGNKIFKPIKNIQRFQYNLIKDYIYGRINRTYLEDIQHINTTIYFSTVKFFKKIKAHYVLLPLTTRMISSPGAIYGKYAIDYTTDTLPIKLKWFNLKREIFLSESSQIYLELALLQKNIDHVFCIYNSFRKEKADLTHLSEFHHIEYEGKINQEENENLIIKFVKFLIKSILEKNESNLRNFLNQDEMDFLNKINFKKVTLKNALQTLYEETGKKEYSKFSCQHFGCWEEIKITNLFKAICIVKEFPLLEIPFYHAMVRNKKIYENGKEILLAKNSDFIWLGCREFIGSGERIKDLKELLWKAKLFNLPKKDYEPYLNSRKNKKYHYTSGFGMGWERFLHGLLKMPTIVHVAHFPRVHFTLLP